MVLLYAVTYSNRSGSVSDSILGLSENQANLLLKLCRAARFSHTVRAYLDEVQEIKNPTLLRESGNSDKCDHLSSCSKYSNNHLESCPAGEASPKEKEKKCYAFPCMSPMCHDLKFCEL